MTNHVHEPEPGSVWDAAGTWRPTAEQAAGQEPFRATCRTCGYMITRTHESEWEVASLTEIQEQAMNRVVRVGEFDVDLTPASPGPAWEWPVNDLGGQDPHPSGGTDENDMDEEVQ